jgi:hypothetical protein
MSLTTYTDLQQAIADWLERADLSARIPDFVVLFEAAANRRLRLRQQEALNSYAGAPDLSEVALPIDFLAARRLTWFTGDVARVELEYVQPSYLQAALPVAPSGVPRIYTIERSKILFRPAGGTTGTLELNYFQKIPPLAAGANWLFGSHPDLYLFGTLAEACLFVPEKAALAPAWKARRDEIFDELDRLNNKARAASVGGVRIMGQTP